MSKFDPTDGAQRGGEVHPRPRNRENAAREPDRRTGAVLSAATGRRKRIWPAKVPVTGQAKRRCAPVDPVNPPRTPAKSAFGIS